MRIGLLENRDEIQKEFDLWEKTINKGYYISMTLLTIGFVSTLLSLWLLPIIGLYSLLFMLGFGGVAIFYLLVITDRKIRAHVDRIDELSK